MAEYGDWINENEMDDYFNEIDDPDYCDEDNLGHGPIGDYPTINVKSKKKDDYDHGKFPVEKNYKFILLDDSLIKANDEWLLRIGINCRLNTIVKIVSFTKKAVLFEFLEENYTTDKVQLKGKQFWLPKSILYKHKKEIKVIYVPEWTEFNIIK